MYNGNGAPDRGGGGSGSGSGGGSGGGGAPPANLPIPPNLSLTNALQAMGINTQYVNAMLDLRQPQHEYQNNSELHQLHSQLQSQLMQQLQLQQGQRHTPAVIGQQQSDLIVAAEMLAAQEQVEAQLQHGAHAQLETHAHAQLQMINNSNSGAGGGGGAGAGAPPAMHQLNLVGNFIAQEEAMQNGLPAGLLHPQISPQQLALAAAAMGSPRQQLPQPAHNLPAALMQQLQEIAALQRRFQQLPIIPTPPMVPPPSDPPTPQLVLPQMAVPVIAPPAPQIEPAPPLFQPVAPQIAPILPVVATPQRPRSMDVEFPPENPNVAFPVPIVPQAAPLPPPAPAQIPARAPPAQVPIQALQAPVIPPVQAPPPVVGPSPREQQRPRQAQQRRRGGSNGGGGRGGRGGRRAAGRTANQESNVVEGPPRVDEALSYLRVIKSSFDSRVDIYHKFLEIMKNFRAQRIDTPEVIEQVADLLYEQPELVLGFNTFLPAGYQISLTLDSKYVFTAPASLPRVLPTPAERENGRTSRPVDPNDPNDGDVRDAERMEEEEEEEGSNEEMEQEPERMEGIQEGGEVSEPEERVEQEQEEEEVEEEEEAEEIVEQVIKAREEEEEEKDEEDEDELQERLEKLQMNSLKVLEKITAAFVARPPKQLVLFNTFIDFYIGHVSYYFLGKRPKEKESEEAEETDPNQPGPAPPPQPVPEPMEEGEEGEKEKEEEEVSKVVEEMAYEHLKSMLATVCLGDPGLLASILEFLPHLNQAISFGGDPFIKRILDQMRKMPKKSEGASDSESVSKADDSLREYMELLQMGSKKNLQTDKLRITKRTGAAKRKTKENNENEQREEEEEIVVLEKNSMIIWNHIKERVSPIQMSKIIKLIGMYNNLEVSPEQMCHELPKIMGVQGSEVEGLLRGMLGLKKERPENDPDAVMKTDLPAPQHAKRGLRDQKQLQNARKVEAATVCTLGPSYRLMKDTRETDCSGRVELSPELKGVMNDTWTSYPSWSSEDPGSQAVKRSNLEEFHSKTEEERYELDIIVDSNRTIIEQLSKTLRELEKLSDEQIKHVKLDDSLNCSSESTMKRVLAKVYTNSSTNLIEAAKKKPVLGIRTILDGLKQKDAEWSKFQQETNRLWRDAMDRHLQNAAVSLTNQQKHYDLKAFKSKPLVQQIEQVYEERIKKNPDEKSAHLVLEYSSEPRVYRDVNDVTGHFFHEIPGAKTEKDRAKLVLFRVLMDWLCQPAQTVVIDTENGRRLEFNGDSNECAELLRVLKIDSRRIVGDRVVPFGSPSDASPSPTPFANAAVPMRQKFHEALSKREQRVFFGDDDVYMIIRFHHLIVERFAKILATQAVYSQESLDNQRKHEMWAKSVGADMKGRKVLERNLIERREAVDDIRNVRTSPGEYYEQTIRELKQVGSISLEFSAFEETIKQLFPGEGLLFHSMDKLFAGLAKNVHHATVAEQSANPIMMYLKFAQRWKSCATESEWDHVHDEYMEEAAEHLRGKNTYRFEFVAGHNPFCKIWLIPRGEEADKSPDNDDDENEGAESGTGGANGDEDGDEGPTSGAGETSGGEPMTD
ncbi:unnamed protein product [Caenorhabditis sp. 36 PRJEB53466]|nr:unnamed protein product [Caenorhabditis sp. 36 PRJEB53466]